MRHIFLLIAIVIAVMVLFNPQFVYADHGLVPCHGIDCSLCDLFSLVQNVFNFVVTDLVPVLAIVLIIWSGFVILTAGGNPANVAKGRKMITSTVIGIVIVYTAYLAVSFVVRGLAGTSGVASFSFQDNQFKVQCSGGEIKDVASEFLKDGSFSFSIGEDLAVSEPQTVVDPDEVSASSVFNIELANSNVDISGLNSDVASSLREAGRLAHQGGTRLIVTDGVRSLTEQQRLVDQNCPSGATQSKQCNPETCIPRDGGANCRHVSRKAVDVWGWELEGERKCCQDTVRITMGSSGFCVLKSEEWHFELRANLLEDAGKVPGRLTKFDCSAASR